MSSTIGRRRYLTNFEPHRLPHLFTDVIIVGGGIAGLRAALAAGESADVLVLTKDEIEQSNTRWAQGGIASAVAADDSPADHAADTIRVACGLGNEAIIRGVVEEAPHHIEQLLAWGARFDRTAGQLAIGREGGHSAARILHADGDATGRELMRTLIDQVRRRPRVRVFERCFTIDLLTRDGAALGVVTFHPKYGHQIFWAGSIILATGGVGRVYRETTNSPIATGDGLAMALRAGAVLRDMEMIQFHPTTLYIAGAARALISEAVRGEGAYLRNRAGERFMQAYDARGELASRDIVSRAINAEMKKDGAPCAYLDVRHFAPGHFEQRFPGLHKLCLDFDIRPERDLIPVRPTAHYTVGGVVTDAQGRVLSDARGKLFDGLLAAGEVASTGLHGANRLASNSLLEGLVFGARAGALAAQRAQERPRPDSPPRLSHLLPQSARTELDLEDVLHSLRSVMSRNVAIERSADRLRETLEIVEFWSRYVMDKVFDAPVAWETQNLLSIAWCIATAAATRCESRGVHFRTDYPSEDPEWRRHVDLQRADDAIQCATKAVGG